MVVGLLQLVWNRLWWWGRRRTWKPFFTRNRQPCLDNRRPRDSCQNQQTRSIYR